MAIVKSNHKQAILSYDANECEKLVKLFRLLADEIEQETVAVRESIRSVESRVVVDDAVGLEYKFDLTIMPRHTTKLYEHIDPERSE